MALGITCLEIMLAETALIDKEEVQELLSILWEFTNSDQLDLWHEKICDFDIEFSIEGANEYLEKELEEMFICVMYIGINNLYGGTGEFSKETLNSTIDVLKIMENHGFQIPDLTKFEKSRFSEGGGLGI